MKYFYSLILILALSLGAFAQSGDPLPAAYNQLLATASAPSNGVNCIQTITFGGTPTGGTFKLTFQGHQTGAIAWTSTDATLVTRIDTALEALTNVSNAGGGGVTTAAGTVSSGIGTVTVTFTGNQAKLLLPVMTVSSSLTGSSPTLACAITTAGVTADGRLSAKGALCIDYADGTVYQNAGTAPNPSWGLIGNQVNSIAQTATIQPAGALVLSGTAHPAGALVVSGTTLKLYLTGSTGQVFTGVAF